MTSSPDRAIHISINNSLPCWKHSCCTVYINNLVLVNLVASPYFSLISHVPYPPSNSVAVAMKLLMSYEFILANELDFFMRLGCVQMTV